MAPCTEATTSTFVTAVPESAKCALEWCRGVRWACTTFVDAQAPTPGLHASAHEAHFTLMRILYEAAARLLALACARRAARVVILATVGAACGHIDEGAVQHLLAECWFLKNFRAMGARAKEGRHLAATAEAVWHLEEPRPSSRAQKAAGISFAAQVLPFIRLHVDLHDRVLREWVADHPIDARTGHMT